jgi:hypothetical protein
MIIYYGHLLSNDLPGFILMLADVWTLFDTLRPSNIKLVDTFCLERVSNILALLWKYYWCCIIQPDPIWSMWAAPDTDLWFFIHWKLLQAVLLQKVTMIVDPRFFPIHSYNFLQFILCI